MSHKREGVKKAGINRIINKLLFYYYYLIRERELGETCSINK
jgi:hypothetical protein